MSTTNEVKREQPHPLDPKNLLALIIIANRDGGAALHKTMAQYSPEILTVYIAKFITYLLKDANHALDAARKQYYGKSEKLIKENAEKVREKLFLSLHNFLMLLPNDVARIVQQAMLSIWEAKTKDETYLKPIYKQELVNYFYQWALFDFDKITPENKSKLSDRLKRITTLIFAGDVKDEIYSKIILFGVRTSADASTKAKLKGFLQLLHSIDFAGYARLKESLLKGANRNAIEELYKALELQFASRGRLPSRVLSLGAGSGGLSVSRAASSVQPKSSEQKAQISTAKESGDHAKAAKDKDEAAAKAELERKEKEKTEAVAKIKQ